MKITRISKEYLFLVNVWKVNFDYYIASKFFVIIFRKIEPSFNHPVLKKSNYASRCRPIIKNLNSSTSKAYTCMLIFSERYNLDALFERFLTMFSIPNLVKNFHLVELLDGVTDVVDKLLDYDDLILETLSTANSVNVICDVYRRTA